MRGAIRLFEAFGIPVNLHVTFFLLPLFWLVAGDGEWVFLIPIIFAFVTLHELCHALTAKHFGIRVNNITLFPIGGVASLSRMPDTPGQEFLISVAGPLFNIFAAALIWGFLFLGPGTVTHTYSGTLAAARGGQLYLLLLIARLNIVIAFFNLLPAFPMDGGRILRSALAGRVGHLKATRIAVSLGHLFAVFFGIYGLMRNLPFLVLIAVFLYTAASAERVQVELREEMKRRRAAGGEGIVIDVTGDKE